MNNDQLREDYLRTAAELDVAQSLLVRLVNVIVGEVADLGELDLEDDERALLDEARD